jgi:hypothetical protein
MLASADAARRRPRAASATRMVHSATLTVDTAASPAAATTSPGSMLVLLPSVMGTLAHAARVLVAGGPRTSAP